MSSGPGSDPGDPQNDASGGSASKRRRVALACQACRRRKLKCDRIMPVCGRCVKAGQQSSCTYDSDAWTLLNGPNVAEYQAELTGLSNHIGPLSGRTSVQHGSISSQHQRPVDSDAEVISRQSRYIQLLERKMGNLEANHERQSLPKSARRRDLPAVTHPEPLHDEVMMFKGRHFKTGFYGASHHMSTLSQLPKMRSFMRDMITRRNKFAQVSKDLKRSKIKTKLYDGGPVNNDTLKSTLPAQKSIVDPLVQVYVQTFESTYRVLHLPSFREEYDGMWQSMEHTRPAFVCLVLLMCASTACLDEAEPRSFRGDSSLSREKASRWIDVCQSWLDQQSHKHITMVYVQCQCVLYIAKLMNSIKRKRYWNSAGTLLSFGVSIGLNRDGELVNLTQAGPGAVSKPCIGGESVSINRVGMANRRVSLFDQEMRRRIWSTICELELQASIDRGMPPMMPDLVVDCGAPKNCDDDAFNPEMAEDPASKSIEEFTWSSFQHWMADCWSLRQGLVSIINGSGKAIPHDEMLIYDQAIVTALARLPAWDVAEAALARALPVLQLNLLRALLHRPFVFSELRALNYSYSSTVQLQAAQHIISCEYDLFRSKASVMPVLFRQDTVAATLAICHSHEAVADAASTNAQQTWQEALACLSHALEMIEDKIMRVGIGIQDYYVVSAALGLLKRGTATASETSAKKRDEEFEAANRLATIITRVLSLQDGVHSVAATLASLPTATSNGLHTSAGSVENVISGKGAGEKGVDPLGTAAGTPSAAFGAEDFSQLDEFGLNIPGWDIDAFFDF